MKVKLEFKDLVLIQAIRATQAVMEAGATVSVKPSHVALYKYLSKHFDIKAVTTDAPLVDSALSHSIPYVRIGNETRVLLYPHAILQKCREMWSNRRKGILFIGLIPDFRRDALKKWQGIAEIEETDKGRRSRIRFWDEAYYKRLARAGFVLCPNGGYPWSYRFFEAIMCGATPIVQEDLPCYEGFYYHKWDDKEFIRDKVEENRLLAIERLTIDRETLLKNLIRKQ